MSNEPNTSPIWWGLFELEELDQVYHWHVGPLSLWARRRWGEWWLAHQSTDDLTTSDFEPMHEVAEDDVPPTAKVSEYAVSGNLPDLRFEARLADRPVVTRPYKQFAIPAGEEVVLFVASPLWAVIHSDEPRRELCDIPFYRPSDTWFGPTNADGELCYAAKTHCHVRIAEGQVRSHRATTAVTIRNRASDLLVLERLKLPVDTLAAYLGADRRVWTQDITMTRTERGEYAQMVVNEEAPRHALEPVRLIEPRRPHIKNAVMRAFSTLFA